MKKIYQQPNTEIVEVELQQMIAESDTVGKGGSYDGQMTIESRRYNYDDEYEDEWDE